MKTKNYFAGCFTNDDARRKYKELALELHPDLNKDSDTTALFQEMKKQIQIQAQNQSTGKTFPVIFESEITERGGLASSYRAFGAIVTLSDENGGNNIKISEYSFSQAKKGVESLFGVKLKKSNIFIRVTDQSWAELNEVKEKVQAEADKIKSEYKARVDAQPRKYARYDFLDWGDYSITRERKVFQVYESLDTPGHWIVEETVAELNDSRIGEYSDEWEAMTGKNMKVGKYREDLGIFEISEAEAWKWVDRAREADQIKADEEAEKQRIREEKEAVSKAERQSKFDEAATTGKKVVLHSVFLSGSEIPRKYRDEDNDMGHLIVWANPDGSTSETFSPSY